MAALAATLIDYGIYVYICTDRPRFLYQMLPEENWQYRECNIDGGVVHQENLKADLPATKAMLLQLFARREELVAEETQWLREQKIDLVIADIPYFIIEACGYAGIPVFGVSNFDWAFIYGELFADDPDLQIVINTIWGLYRRLDYSYIPALGTTESVPGFSNPEEMGLLARSSKSPVRDYGAPILSIMFGGEGDMEIPFDELCAAWDGIVLSTNPDCQAINHRRVNPEDDFLAIIKSSRLVLCKPGYSTFAEILSSGIPMLYLPRQNYPEERVLISGLDNYSAALQVLELPTDVAGWRLLFAQMPEVGRRVEAKNNVIVGSIMRDFLSLREPEASYLSIFDLGSNNLNYCIWNIAERKAVHRNWITTSLARNFKDNKLSFTDLSEEIPALKALLETDAQISSEKALIATGIMRKAENADSLVEKLSSAWQLKAKIISGKEELKYAWYAAAPMIPLGQKAVVLDIGGSSTELVWQGAHGAVYGHSLAMGLISLAEELHPEASIAKALSELALQDFDLLISVGLTATLLAKLSKGKLLAMQPPNEKIWISKAELMGFIQKLDAGTVETSTTLKKDTLQLYTMKLAAQITEQLLDRYSLLDFMVCNDGISIGYARWKTRKK